MACPGRSCDDLCALDLDARPARPSATSPLPSARLVKDLSAISRKNQITIPAAVLRAAGLHPGDDVRVESVGPGRIVLVRTEALVERYAGSLDDDTYPPGYLDEVREGWR